MLKNSFRPSRILSHKHGFTLVELLVVIVVLGILATITVKIATNVGDSTSEARARADLAVLSTALERYKMKNSDYPHKADNNEVLNALMGFTGS
jgi:general secretion pathway protein G